MSKANMDPKKQPMPVQPPEERRCNFREVALGYSPDQAAQEAARCLHCKNKPCVAGCPVGIDIPGCFTMLNYLKKYDLADWAKGRYGAMAHKADECVRCGACEARCPYELPIRKLLEETAAAFAG